MPVDDLFYAVDLADSTVDFLHCAEEDALFRVLVAQHVYLLLVRAG